METTGKHAAPGDRSLAISVAIHLAVAAALIVAVIASLSGFVGLLRSEAPPVILDLGSAGEDGAGGVVDPPDDEPIGSLPETDGEEEPAPPEADPEEADDAASERGGEPEDDPDDPTSAEQRRAEALDPNEITVQVLDGAGDGGTRAGAIVGELQEEGFRIVSQQRAVGASDRSRVYYSDGAEDAARKVAGTSSDLGVIEPKPSRLSDAVMVHIVVGRG
jgi:hypothetical protein